MRIVLRRRIPPHPPSVVAAYRQIVLDVPYLTIGRAADQHVQLDHAEVAPRHATLAHAGGRLEVRAVDQARLTVNGRLQRRARLAAGDLVTVGEARLTVEQVRGDGVIVLRLNDPHALAAERVEWPHEQSLAGTRLNPRLFSWLLVWTVILGGFLVPLGGALIAPLRPMVRAAALLPSDTLWLPGPVHQQHRAIGSDCNACHTRPFVRVAPAACEACHRSVQNHVPAASPAAHLFAAAECTSCHLEHDAQKSLVNRDSASCLACHGDLKSLKPDTHAENVADFSHGHPEFPFQSSTDRQTPALRFSHKVHLAEKGIDSPRGTQHLACGNCHQPDAGGRVMQPVRMEAHCAGCHTLQFDEHDPGSKLPHGNLDAVFRSLREHFSRTFLDGQGADASLAARRRPGDEDRVLTREEQRRALAWAESQTVSIAREILEKRLCVECHTIDKIASASGVPQWRVEPVNLTHSWFPQSSFSHAAHATSACTSCHRGTTLAEEVGPIHMPGIATCRGCHADDDSRKVVTTCITCHRFHRDGNGPLLGEPPRTAPR